MANYNRGPRRTPPTMSRGRRAPVRGRKPSPPRGPRRAVTGRRGGGRKTFTRAQSRVRRPVRRSSVNPRTGFRTTRRTSGRALSGSNRSTFGGNQINSWETSYKQELGGIVHSDSNAVRTSYKNGPGNDAHSDVSGPGGKNRTGLSR